MVSSSLASAELNPAQQMVADYGVLESGFSCVLQLATGAGKTWLAKQAIRESIRRGLRAVYLCPLRALADELASEWQREFEDVPVGVFTGDYGRPGRSYPVPYQEAKVLIMTPERLDACTRRWRSHWSWFPEVDWLVVDEIHLLGDGHRGARLEGAISRFRRLNPLCRVLGLSATLGNREELADWLEGVELQSDWRPVPLEWEFVHFRKAEEKPELLLAKLTEPQSRRGQTIVFVQSRRRAESLAAFLSEHGLRASHHHAGLDHGKRKEVEQAFRTRETDVVVATGTLEMGLNLPAHQVILYDLQGFDGVGFSPLSVNTIWQRAGRAGRPGFDTEGHVVLLAPRWEKEDTKLTRGQFEPILSRIFEPRALAEQILTEVHAGTARTLTQLGRVFASSLASNQARSLDLPTALQTMLDAGMLCETGDDDEHQKLAATPLGRIACRHQLHPETVLLLCRFLESHNTFTHFDLLVVIATTTDCEPVLSVDYEDIETLTNELGQQSSRLFESVSDGCKFLEIGGKRLLSALKASVVLSRWMQLGDIDTVAEEDGCYPFEIVRLCESIDRLLLATASIRKLIDQPPSFQDGADQVTEQIAKSMTHRRIELLRQMISTGLDERSASLTFVKGIGARWATKLVNHNIVDLPKLAGSKVHILTQLCGLSAKRAETWIAKANESLTDIPPAVEAPHLQMLPVDVDLDVDPYRLRRALDLTVQHPAPNEWRVTGGLEPHIVSTIDSQTICDCRDHANGHCCKHILAVRLSVGDAKLRAVADSLEGSSHLTQNYLDLFQLWFDRS